MADSRAHALTAVAPAPGWQIAVDKSGETAARRVDIADLGLLFSTAVKTSAYTAAVGEQVLTNSAAGAFNVTLPAAPVNGSRVGLLDTTGSWPTFAVTVLPGAGDTVQGTTALTCDDFQGAVILEYIDQTNDWRLVDNGEIHQISPLDAAQVTYTPPVTGGVTRFQRDKNMDVIFADDHGVPRDGTDGTTAFRNLMRYMLRGDGPPNGRYFSANATLAPTSADYLVGGAIHLRSGHYKFTAPFAEFGTNPDALGGLASGIVLIGEDRDSTVIEIANADYLFIFSLLLFLRLENIRFVGGKGVVLETNTGTSVFQSKIVQNCMFLNQTEAAIATRAIDNPYWKIRDNIFRITTAATGIAINGFSDMVDISGNDFWTYKYAVHLGWGGNSATIKNNNMMGAVSGGADIWISPRPDGATVNAGQNLQIIYPRFGNEFHTAGVTRILLAEAVAGNFEVAAHSTTASVKPIVGGAVRGGLFNSSGYMSTPLITAYARPVGWQVEGLSYQNLPNYLVYYPTLFEGSEPERSNVMNLTGGAVQIHSRSGLAAGNDSRLIVSNMPDAWRTIDPDRISSRPWSQLPVPAGGLKQGGLVALNVGPGGLSTVSASLTTAVNGPSGASDLVQPIVFSATSGYAYASLPDLTAYRGRRAWLQAAIAAPATRAMPAVNLWIRLGNSVSKVLVARTIDLPTIAEGYVSLAIPFTLPVGTGVGATDYLDELTIVVEATLGTVASSADTIVLYRLAVVVSARPVELLSSDQIIKTGVYTISTADHETRIPCTGSWTMTVPSAATLGSGFQCEVANVGAGSIVIDGPSGSNLTLAANEVCSIKVSGAVLLGAKLLHTAL